MLEHVFISNANDASQRARGDTWSPCGLF